MSRQCPRCKSEDTGDGPYCKRCKFPIRIVGKSEGPPVRQTLVEQEHSRCIRCGVAVSHETLCSRCRADLQFDKLRNRRRW